MFFLLQFSESTTKNTFNGWMILVYSSINVPELRRHSFCLEVSVSWITFWSIFKSATRLLVWSCYIAVLTKLFLCFSFATSTLLLYLHHIAVCAVNVCYAGVNNYLNCNCWTFYLKALPQAYTSTNSSKCYNIV